MKEWFLGRGYPEIVVINQIDKVAFGRDQSVQKNLPSGIPFVTTYQPNVKELRELIRDVLPFLCSDREVQKVFSPPPIISYRIARKMKYIVRFKQHPVERKAGCRGCDSSRCQVCKSISITDEFTGFTAKKTYRINHSLIAMIKCLIYMEVTPPAILEVDGLTVRVMLEKLSVVT